MVVQGETLQHTMILIITTKRYLMLTVTLMLTSIRNVLGKVPMYIMV